MERCGKDGQMIIRHEYTGHEILAQIMPGNGEPVDCGKGENFASLLMGLLTEDGKVSANIPSFTLDSGEKVNAMNGVSETLDPETTDMVYNFIKFISGGTEVTDAHFFIEHNDF